MVLQRFQHHRRNTRQPLTDGEPRHVQQLPCGWLRRPLLQLRFAALAVCIDAATGPAVAAASDGIAAAGIAAAVAA
jgi:hypothetical protein